MGGGAELVNFTCQAHLRRGVHKNLLISSSEGEKDNRGGLENGEDTQR